MSARRGDDEPDRSAVARSRLLIALGLAAVLASRVAMIYSPYFEEIQYERAPMGLEALAILRGETPVMNWSEPYHGTVFSYLLAPFYALKRDPILTYSWVSVVLNLLGSVAVYLFARRAWGPLAGLAALAYLTLAPAFFPFYDVNSYALFVTLGGIGCYAALRHLTDRPDHCRWLWLCGVSLGASVWCHQLGVCFVAAVGLTFLVDGRLSFFFGRDCWRLAVGLAIGAAPLIAWNAVFHWIVLRNFTSPDYSTRPLEASLEGFWDSVGSMLGANTQFWKSPVEDGWTWLHYGQVVFAVLVLFALAQWISASRARRATRIGSGMLLVLVATTATLYSKSRWGVDPGFSRYLIPMCFAIPIFAGGLVAMLTRRSSAAGALALLLLVIPGINDRRHYEAWGTPAHGYGARLGVALLERLGVTRAYAHDRISLPLTLASRERIIVSDYYGIPHEPYLDAVDDAAAPAIVAHHILKTPSPQDVDRSLPTLHGAYRRAEEWPYVVYYDFHPPKLAGGWLSSAHWKLTASTNPDALSAIADRDPLSVWSTERTGRKGDWVEIDLGEVHRVDEVHVLSGVRIHDAAGASLVETSLDDRTWAERSRAIALNWYWWNGHPKHDDNGRVSFYFDPVEARYLRVRLLEPTILWNWSIAEIFVRAADAPESHAGEMEFRQGLLAERRGEMAINYHSIHAMYARDADSTPWGEVIADYWRAIDADPDDPDFMCQLMRALWINGFIGPSPNGIDALHYERLGLEEAAAREYAACATSEDALSICVDRSLARATDPEEIRHLQERRRERFDPVHRLDASFGAVTLLGTGEIPERAAPGETIPITLYWRSNHRLHRPFAVFVHLTGPGRFQSDHLPTLGRLAVDRWVPGETIRDSFSLTIPRDAAPGVYRATIGMWDPARHLRLRRGWFGKSEADAFVLRVGA